MEEKISLIVTSISGPNKALCQLAEGAQKNNCDFIVIGDQASPKEFQLEGCDFYSLEKQKQLDLDFAKKCPTKHYARKNIGYLLAIAAGSSVIIETDDDNLPYDQFWSQRQRKQNVATVENGGWVNAYKYFTDEPIWPRGLPLEVIQNPIPDFESLAVEAVDCPIQQGLANENPDVDAVYRLVGKLPQNFRDDRRVAISKGSWCPFNSQNTSWWSEAFGLLYLPSHCSFRMTDIWRSFVAQRIAWVNGWSVLFSEASVWQERNEHNLMRDFEDEIPGYLNNSKICLALERLNLKSGVEKIGDNLKTCYEKLVEMSIVGGEELPLIDAWNSDLKKIRNG